MLYFNDIIRFRKWKLIILGLFCVALGLKVALNTLRLTAGQLTDLSKCPACFGLSICDAVLKNKILIRHRNAYSTFANIFGGKNVFYANYGRDKVVLKKLARSSELDNFDRIICDDDKLADICPSDKNQKNIPYSIDFYARISKDMNSDFNTDNVSSLRLCPTTEHIDDLFYNVYANSGEARKQISHAYIWTMVKINPEPLILQILPAEEGWPVPRYLGACGRLVVEEFVGPTLSNYYKEPWIRRAKIAESLLNSARMFTYRNPNFGFYLTDVSPDNIAVDQHDNAKFIDMENVIVVDKRGTGKNHTSDWYDIEVNEADINCQNCLAFSPIDICRHRYSDHNYYAVCQHLLAQSTSSSLIPGGLLHDVPNEILINHPNLPSLIEQCAVPTSSRSRIVVGDLLRELLNDIVRKTT